MQLNIHEYLICDIFNNLLQNAKSNFEYESYE